MPNTDKKQTTPPYATYRSFINLINDLVETGMPPEISYTVLKGSNSGKAMIAATLRYLDLIDGNKVPTSTFKHLVDNKGNYSINLESLLRKHYPYLFDESINLENTTTEMVIKKFKEQGASGSTISKCMAFFLTAAKDAKIIIHERVKAPPPVTTAKPKKPKQNSSTDIQEENQNGGEPEVLDGMEQITIPLRGMEDGIISFPKQLDDADAKRAINMTKYILMQYYGLTDD